MGWEGVAWIHVAQERNKWLPVVCLIFSWLVGLLISYQSVTYLPD